MHMRLAPSLAGGRRFLLGDAGHLSSPFGGEGLNCGIHDGHKLGWKLALTLEGRARPALLESFSIERERANRHVLEVSDELHAAAHQAVDAARNSERPPPLTPGAVAALVRSRSMLDVSYAGSPIVATFDPNGGGAADGAPAPGERDPHALRPTIRHTIVVAPSAVRDPALARLSDRWLGLVAIEPDPTAAGVMLVRPDGHVGFRSPTADAAGLSALDAHLSSYLIAADGSR
jgi:hypothetical protein